MTYTKNRRVRGCVDSLAVVGVLPFLLVACSSQPDADTAPRADAGIGAQWGACMRDAGFAVQDRADQSAFSEAAASCSEQAGVEPASDADQQKWKREYAEVASCVGEDHRDSPEQDDGGFGVDDSYPHADEPAFKDTVAKCMAEFSPDTKYRPVP